MSSMTTYRLEVLADYPASKGIPSDVAAEVVYAASEREMEVIDVTTRRARGTDLVCVDLTFDAADDEAALELLAALPGQIRWTRSVEATHLRTGRGKSFRRIR